MRLLLRKRPAICRKTSILPSRKTWLPLSSMPIPSPTTHPRLSRGSTFPKSPNVRRRLPSLFAASREGGSILNHPDEGQLAEGVGDVHPVADHQQVGADEADMISVERLGALARLLQEHRDADAAGAALAHALPGEGKGAAGFEDVVDEEHIA